MKGCKINPDQIHEKASELIHARKRGGALKGVDEASEDKRTRDEDTDEEEHKEVREGDKEERKHGGKLEKKERKRGGKLEKKHIGKVEGEKHEAHAGRAPRKRGGAVESSPFSGAKEGTPATGRKLAKETMD